VPRLACKSGFKGTQTLPIRFEGLRHARYLTFSCYKRSRLFKDSYLCSLFIQHLQRARERHSFHLWAFVIMPNHIHLLIRPQEDSTVSTILQAIKRPFSYQALEFIRTKCPIIMANLMCSESSIKRIYRFWQHGGGYDRNIFKINALKETINYIHNNPVRAGLVKEPTEWCWSSARFWIQGNPEPLTMDEMELF